MKRFHAWNEIMLSNQGIFIVVGWSRVQMDGSFEACNLMGRVTNTYGVENEDTFYHAVIYLCRELCLSWPEFWKQIQTFGYTLGNKV